MRKVKVTLALCAIAAVSAILAGCGSSLSGDSVAEMAGNPISNHAFNHWMYVAAKSQAAQSPGQPVIVPNDPPNFSACIAQVRKDIPSLAKTKTATLRSDCKQLFTSLSSQVMDFLIKAYWYQAQASKMGIKVSDAQVQKAFSVAKGQQFKTAAQYQAFLAQTGQTQEDILFRFRINQIYTKLLAKQNTKVTPAQIQAYYNSHKSQFGTPQTRDMRIVLTKTAAEANAAKAAIQHGQSWAAVAKKYSVDSSTKNSGGLLLGVIKGQQDAALDKLTFSAAANQLLGPVKGQFGYYIAEVVKIHAATQQSLTQATPLIKQTLTGQRQNTAQSAVDSAAKKAWQSKTKCRSQYSMADCSGYKASSSSSSSSKSGTSTASTSTTG